MINENNCYNYVLLLKQLVIDKEDKRLINKFIKRGNHNKYQSKKNINYIVWSIYLSILY